MNFPYFNKQTNDNADLYHSVCLIIKHIEYDNQRLEHVEEHWTDRQTLQGLTTAPELDIWNQTRTKKHLMSK